MALRDPVTADQVSGWLGRSSGWSGGTAGIRKSFAVGYDDAIQIVTEVAAAAIELEHRPDIDIRWDRLSFAMTTHTAGDVVTELDFLLAQRIDWIAAAHGAEPVT
jgi:4a-hydroxytetrahydrobiopterin dehydratase